MILVGALQTPNFPTCCICGCRDKSKLIGFELSHEILTSKHRFNLCKNHAMELADDIDELVKRKYKESKHEEIRSGKKQNNLLARWKMKTCATCRYSHRKGYYRVWGIKEYFSDLKTCLKCRLIKSQWRSKHFTS